jgi:hypothetical protein
VTPIGRLLCLVAAVSLLAGALLPWSGVVGEDELVPLDLRSQWAFGLGGERTTGVWPESVLFVLVVAAILVLIAAITGSVAVGLVGAAVAGASALAWVLQVADRASGVDSTLIERLGTGVAVTALGVLLVLVAAVFMRQPREDSVIVG